MKKLLPLLVIGIIVLGCKKDVSPIPRPPAFLFTSYINPYNGVYVSDSTYYLTLGFIRENEVATTMVILQEVYVNPETGDIYSKEGRVYFSPTAHRRIMATSDAFNESVNAKVKQDGYAILLTFPDNIWELTSN